MPKIIELSGVVGYDITAKGLKNRLPRDGGDVLLKIDSVGGSVYEGNRLYNAINDYPGQIKVELGAIAASAASYFPMAAGIENIAVRENTTFMGHKAWSLAIGNADEMKQEAEILDGFDRIIAKAYAKATGKDVDALLDDMGSEFWLIGGQNVVDAGFASSIITDEEAEEETPDPVDKAEIQARIEEAKIALRMEAEEEDMNQWAARIKADLGQPAVEEDGQNLLFDSAPETGGNINTSLKEERMDLKEFKAQGPEAVAEFDEAVAKAVERDRERVAEIVNLYGNSEKAADAVITGKDVKDMALEEVRENREAAKKATETPVNFGKVTDEGQLPEAVEVNDKEAKQKATDEAVAAYLKGGK